MSLIQLVEEIIQPLLKEIAIVGADGVIKGEPSRKKVKKRKHNNLWLWILPSNRSNIKL